jgi:YD repeat-containing protein
VVISGQGAGLMATVTATDRAGWTTTAVTPPVKIDRTEPEAYNQFSRTQLDVLVYGRDALSGVPAGPVTPTVYPIRWGRHHERDHDHDDWCGEDSRGVAELRTYRVQDRAGNQVSLVEMVKKEGNEIKVYVVGLRYEDADGPGRFIFFWNARKAFEWSVDRNGTLKSLAQMMEVGKDRGRERVEADYDARKNRTTITVKDGGRERKEVRTGLVLLRMVSDHGKMVIEY